MFKNVKSAFIRSFPQLGGLRGACVICVLNILFCLTAVAQNQTERIIRFHSDIVIETDGTVVVTDHEKVYAAGKDIKRGIVREIPIYRENKNGNRVRVDVNVLSVTCNGKKAAYHTETLDYSIEIYIGDANVFLDPGEYEYAITYSSRGHIGFFDGYDELYWNVTGFNDFVIEQASATVTLPAGVAALQTYAYTGKRGEKGQDYTVKNRGNVQVFTATRAFAPNENLSVSVGFPPGIIDRTKTERIIRFHSDIVIETDGTVVVTDHEKVYAAGLDIQRGIVRTIPIYRYNKNGMRVKVDVNVLSVTCNGEKVKYHTEKTDDDIKIYIGDARVFLEPGEYEYAITYSTRGHIGFFDGYDELYWNVTGFNDFAIEQASATVTLPDGATALQTS
jgi:hypothetical protein